MKPLNLFYEEPAQENLDRWIKFDRYPRNLIRRIIRGKPLPGGPKMVFLNLCKGFDLLKIKYKVNDYKYISKHPEELACIIGKNYVLEKRTWKNPILFGAATGFSHSVDYPDFFEKYPTVSKILVPGEWMRKMLEPAYGNKVQAWPVGIDTNLWHPITKNKTIDFLIYNKIRWKHDHYYNTLLQPIKELLKLQNLSFTQLDYGHYKPEELKKAIEISKAAIFICEHETQGLAYQQMLSCDLPIFAWDRGGFWQDPEYYPHRVKYEGGVSSVPYWDDKCGMKFSHFIDFKDKINIFLNKINDYSPRNFILKNLTLEVCSQKYIDIVNSLSNQ